MDMNVLSRVGVFIKSNRKNQKLTQGKMADLVGVSRVAFNRWERGLVQPRYRHCMAMAGIFQTDCLAFLVPLYPRKAKYVNEIRRLARL